ncbi:hypothetical protein J5N97_008995 [Dioscorea zingiberensis]|uniref:Cationic amino acid transporter C-terminal domain-containing protein n=1 Tax=Dioscorea zingiberensis TaxID=325984 RepID=A0A9D5CYM7_9LILI|nr:hypothetical protein J5N97_008995 [Dioscorea zingiberensis]
MEEEGKQRCCCSCSKEDFFPEESFKSWGNYGRALMQTGARLRDRITTRSLDETELNQVKARSGHEMKRNLTWWDLIWFGIASVIGSGIFVLTGQEASQSSGPAVIISYVISGVSAMLSVLCYTEFAVEIPVAGGSFAYLRVELGDLVAFIAGGNILMEYVISGAAVARSWTSYFATLLNHHPNDFRILAPSLSPNYNQLDPLAVLITVLISLIPVFSVKGSSRFNYLFSILHIAVLLFIVIAGLTRAHPSNLSPFAPFGASGIFSSAAVLFFAYIGFDAVSTMAEETRHPPKDIPIGLVGSMAITTFFYCLLALTLSLMVPYQNIDPNAPFSVAFEQVGMGWAKYIVAFGALKGMTTVLLVASVGQARYMTHIARTHMAPPWLGKVHPKTGTPVNATVVMLVATAIIALFTDLGVLANLLSISTLFIFVLVALALLVRRYYVSGETAAAERNKMVVCLVVIVAAAVGMAGSWAAGRGWVGFAVTVPVWFLGTMGLWLGVAPAREPKKWGVPMVPWLPSASIGINMVLLGSIDRESFERFGVFTVVLLVYYVFFGLHASYDTAKAAEVAAAAPETRVEEGRAQVG